MAVGVVRGIWSWLLVILLVGISIEGISQSQNGVVESGARAGTIVVDINGTGDYTSIQEAINNSMHGSTIYVRPGEYHENIRIFKTLNLIGTDARNTTINGSLGWGSVVEILVNSVTLTGFTITSNNREGIKLKDVQYVQVFNNIYLKNSNGIVISDSDYNYIENNTLLWNEYSSIIVWDSDFNIINHNTILINHDSYSLGIALYNSRSNIITNNSMSYHGIQIYSQFFSHWIHTIENNTLNNKPIIYWKDKLGGKIPPGAGQVILVNCSGVTVENQNCSDGTIGISLAFSNNNTVRNNTCNWNNWVAMELWSSEFNHISNNTGKFNCGGIFLYDGSHSNHIINNVFHSNVNQDIDLYRSNSNVIINNSCS
ncbi:NosD domain-containing protein, partial [[Eubacterium] cellulosolvens]